jgi:acyl-CoA thioesterase FadM
MSTVEENEYAVVDKVIPEARANPHHVVDHELQKHISQGWQNYVAAIRAKFPMPDAVVKQITTTFEAECPPGQPLKRGVRVVSRTRRSYVMEEALWRPDSGQVVATARLVLTGVDRATGHAAEIPADMWAEVEAIEGRKIPMTERSAG